MQPPVPPRRHELQYHELWSLSFASARQPRPPSEKVFIDRATSLLKAAVLNMLHMDARKQQEHPQAEPGLLTPLPQGGSTERLVNRSDESKVARW